MRTVVQALAIGVLVWGLAGFSGGESTRSTGFGFSPAARVALAIGSAALAFGILGSRRRGHQ